MIGRTLSAVAAVAWALSGADALHAQPTDELCAALESVRPGEFLQGQTEVYLTTSTLRPSQEPVSVGRSLVKGAMARRLSDELDGGPVSWSGALLKGPVPCGAFNAYQVQVNPFTVRMSPH